MSSRKLVTVLILISFLLTTAAIALARDSFWDNPTRHPENPVSDNTWGQQSNPYSTNYAHLHPDTVYFSDGYNGYKFWCYYTPYPPNAAEDICLARSNDGINWTFDGVPNPIYDPTTAGHWWSASHIADPDVLYLEEYNRWFLFFGARYSAAVQGSMVLLLSDDGLNYYPYNGTQNDPHKENSPILFSWESEHSPDWETMNAEPTVFYEDGVFHVFYGAHRLNPGTANTYRRGYGTFEWNNTANNGYGNIENRQRVSYFDISANTDQQVGIGHSQVFWYNETLYSVPLRAKVGAGTTHTLGLLKCNSTSPPYSNWTDLGLLVDTSASGWDSGRFYRSCVIHDGRKNAVDLSGENASTDSLWIMYTAEASNPSWKFGLMTFDAPFEPEELDISFQSINNQNNNTVTSDVITSFNWTKVSDTEYYQLQIANDSGFTDVFVDIDVNSTLFPGNYSETGGYVEFVLPDSYRKSWYQDYFFRVRSVSWYDGG